MREQLAAAVAERDALERASAESAPIQDGGTPQTRYEQDLDFLRQQKQRLYESVLRREKEVEALRQATQDSEVVKLAAQLGEQAADLERYRFELVKKGAECDELKRALHEKNLQIAGLSRLTVWQEQQPKVSLAELKERILAKLKLGRQAPAYKVAARALAAFAEEIEAGPPVKVHLPRCAADIEEGELWEEFRQHMGRTLNFSGKDVFHLLQVVALLQGDPRVGRGK